MTHHFDVKADGAGTLLTQRMELEPRGVMRVVAPAMKRSLGKQLERNGAALRARLESKHGRDT